MSHIRFQYHSSFISRKLFTNIIKAIGMTIKNANAANADACLFVITSAVTSVSFADHSHSRIENTPRYNRVPSI